MTQYRISAILLVLFIGLVAGKAIMLKRKGIKAIVFGTTDKSDFLLVPFVLVIVYAIFSRVIDVPMWRPLVATFWDTRITGVAGIAFCAIAVIGFALIIHRQILREERFLESHYGGEYREYRKKVRRYL